MYTRYLEQTIDGAVYTLDAAGNWTSKADQLAGITSNYTYDPIYELTQVAQGNTTTESYSYDPVGNRLSSLGLSPYNYNTSNELTSTPSTSYSYDSNGNLTSETNSSGTSTYAWDYENQMTSATLPNNGGIISFNYDPFGRRIEKVSPTTTSIFAYDGGNLVETVIASGGEVARYTQGQNIDEPLAMERSSTVDYYDADGLGSITSLTASNGTVAQSYTYDSFGNTTNSTGSLTNFFRYTAREFDTETNLYYYRARYYDPSVGRFLSEDPLHFVAGTNFYPYTGNNPVVFGDAAGLWGGGVTFNTGFFGGSGPNSGAAGSAALSGIYLADPRSPLGFTSAGALTLGGYAGKSRCKNANNSSNGLAGGMGIGFTYTNANSINQVAGPFSVTTYGLGPVSVDVGKGANGVYTITVTSGYGGGFGKATYITDTWTNPVSPESFPLPCGCDKP
jgi:RHS repeat-associated protein